MAMRSIEPGISKLDGETRVGEEQRRLRVEIPGSR
jgi:hypothetical protein